MAEECRTKVVYQLSALRVTVTFCTVLENAAGVVRGILPIHNLATEWCRIYEQCSAMLFLFRRRNVDSNIGKYTGTTRISVWICQLLSNIEIWIHRTMEKHYLLPDTASVRLWMLPTLFGKIQT